MKEGRIVWAKLTGYDWWPGKANTSHLLTNKWLQMCLKSIFQMRIGLSRQIAGCHISCLVPLWAENSLYQKVPTVKIHETIVCHQVWLYQHPYADPSWDVTMSIYVCIGMATTLFQRYVHLYLLFSKFLFPSKIVKLLCLFFQLERTLKMCDFAQGFRKYNLRTGTKPFKYGVMQAAKVRPTAKHFLILSYLILIIAMLLSW